MPKKWNNGKCWQSTAAGNQKGRKCSYSKDLPNVIPSVIVESKCEGDWFGLFDSLIVLRSH